jgi:hypothetical protein
MTIGIRKHLENKNKMKLFVSDLEKLSEESHISEQLKLVIDTILMAINDWPVSFDNLDDYNNSVNVFINGKTTKNNLERSLKYLEVKNYAWQIESLTQLLDVFQFYEPDQSLEDIIQKLKDLSDK